MENDHTLARILFYFLIFMGAWLIGDAACQFLDLLFSDTTNAILTF